MDLDSAWDFMASASFLYTVFCCPESTGRLLNKSQQHFAVGSLTELPLENLKSNSQREEQDVKQAFVRYQYQTLENELVF